MFWSEQLRILLQSIVNVIQQVLRQTVPAEKQISDQQLVNLLENKAGVGHHRLDHRFGVSQSTINRHLKKRALLKIYRNTPMNINNNKQNPTVEKLSPDCQLILDEEKCFLY